MLEGLKISRGFTVPDGGVPDIYVVSQGKSRASDDYPCVVVWAEDFDRMAAVVEAEIETADAAADYDKNPSEEAFARYAVASTKRNAAIDAFRAHLVAAAEKGKS